MNVLDMALNGSLVNNVPKQNETVSAEKEKKSDNKRKITTAAAIGSAIGIAGAVAASYAIAKKGNPSLTFSNLTYDEKDILMIGAGSVLGGLTGGLIADKDPKNTIPKLREASQQFFGSLLCPIAILSVAEKALEKSGFKLPQLQGETKAIKAANVVLAALPKIAVTIGSLVAGMNIGNKIMNKVNNFIFKQNENREVHASDYLVHTDDICVAASLLLKDSKALSTITSKLLPASFILAGTKAGSEQAH